MFKNFKNQTRSDQIFDIMTFLFIVIFLMVVLYPLYFIVVASFSNSNDVANGKTLLWFSRFTLEGYQTILEEEKVWVGYRNTIFYTVVGTALNLILTIPAAYALSRKDLKGKNLIMIFFTITMFFNGGLIPTYFTIRDLGLTNSIWVMIIPFSVNVYNLIITKTFFQTSIPEELLEAAKLDGCTNRAFFFKIVLPLSKAVISVILLYYAVAHWNDYFNALIYITDKNIHPLQLVLREMLLRNTQSMGQTGGQVTQNLAELIKYVLIVVSTLPMMILYPFIQKYFEKGVMIGSVKG